MALIPEGKRKAATAGTTQPAAKRKPVQAARPRANAQGEVQSGTVSSAIQGLLVPLPPEGTPWSRQRRNAFIAMIGSVLDYYYPIQEAGNAGNGSTVGTDDDADEEDQ